MPRRRNEVKLPLAIATGRRLARACVRSGSSAMAGTAAAELSRAACVPPSSRAIVAGPVPAWRSSAHMPVARRGPWTAAGTARESGGFCCCNRTALRSYRRGLRPPGRASGCSSGVEHNLAKVGVERSNRFTRSKIPHIEKPRIFRGFRVFSAVDIARRESGSKGRRAPPTFATNIFLSFVHTPFRFAYPVAVFLDGAWVATGLTREEGGVGSARPVGGCGGRQ